MKLLIVSTSVREGRNGRKIANWFMEKARADTRFEVDFVDLKELGLSYELPAMLPSQVKNSEYEREEDRAWAQRINAADAVVFVIPEYNHGISASLKNALDHLGPEWQDKPVGVVGYGAAGAPYSHAMLGLVAGWLKFDIVSPRVDIHEIWAAFNEDGTLNDDAYHSKNATSVLNALAAKVEEK